MANASVQQNAIDHADELPLAAATVHYSFYVPGDGLTGAYSLEGAVMLQGLGLFARSVLKVDVQ